MGAKLTQQVWESFPCAVSAEDATRIICTQLAGHSGQVAVQRLGLRLAEVMKQAGKAMKDVIELHLKIRRDPPTQKDFELA